MSHPTKSHYRRVKVVRAKYADVHGTPDPLENVRYKWPIDEAGQVLLCPDFLVTGVMGQEDIYRDEEGERVQNFLVGRVVASVPSPSRIRVHFGIESWDEFVTGWSEEHEEYPEIFFELFHLNALYQFRVEVEQACSEEVLMSGIHRFTTAGTVVVDPDPITLFIVSLNVLQGAPFSMVMGAPAGEAGVEPDGPQYPFGLFIVDSSLSAGTNHTLSGLLTGPTIEASFA